jgi:hypothetical protein
MAWYVLAALVGFWVGYAFAGLVNRMSDVAEGGRQ